MELLIFIFGTILLIALVIGATGRIKIKR